ncbi:MAG: hypothetical protein HYX86_05485 [Chloroflexi bacterium]|nr:hypothetical protein [Chloroflexota bacterium]
MDFILRFISDYAPWIYIFSGLGAFWVLRNIQTARDEQQAALFSIEREAATNRLTQGIRFLVGILALAGITAAINFSGAAPASSPPPEETMSQPPIIIPTSTPLPPTPTSGPPTPTPTLPPRPTETPSEEPSPTPTPAFVAPACPDPHAIITSPGEGQNISGLVEIRGTAYLESGFREYQIFYAAGENPSESQWAWDYSGKQPVFNGLLHTWDPQGRTGIFTFILRVVKTDGNWLKPCQVTVTVV